MALAFLLALALPAPPGEAVAAGGEAGAVVLQVPAHSPLEAGDRIVGWRVSSHHGTIGDVADWLWFLEEWAPRAGAELELRRGERPLNVALPPGACGIAAGPPLEAALREDVAAALLGGSREAGESRGDLVSRVEKAAGPRAALWLELSLARRRLDADRVRAALALLERAVGRAARCKAARGSILALGLESRALLEAGRPVEAAAVARRVLELSGGAASSGLASAHARRLLGICLWRQGELAEAERQLRTARCIERRLAPGSLPEAATMNRLGRLFVELGRAKEGLRLIRRALALCRRLAPRSLELARVLNTLGGAQLVTGHMGAAAEAFRESLSIREGLPGQPGRFKLLYNLGLVAYQRRRLDEAEHRFEQAQVLLEARGTADRRLAMVLDGRMNVAQERGDLAMAGRLGERALALHRAKDPRSLETAVTLVNLGAVAARQGDYQKARRRYLEALEVARHAAPEGMEVATILANLADIALSEGHYADTVSRSQEALIRLERLGAPAVSIAQVRQNIADAALHLGRLDLAQRQCRRALALRRMAAPRSRDEAESLHLMGKIEERSGDALSARARYEAAIGILEERAPGTVYLAEALYSRAMLRRSLGDRDGAIDALGSAIDALEEQIRRLGGTESVRSAFRERYNGWYLDLEDLLVEAGRPAAAYHVLERSRARSLLGLLADREILTGSGVSRDLQARWRRLALSYDAALAALAGSPPSRSASLRRRLDRIRREQDQLLENIRDEAPRLATLRFPLPLRARAAARLLGKDGAALAYGVAADHTLLFALLPTGTVRAWRISLGRRGLERVVTLFRGLVIQDATESGRTGAMGRASSALFDLLVAPALPALHGIRHLLILPDGPLDLLPFAMLRMPAPGGGRPMAERYSLAVEASMTVLANLLDRPGPPAGAYLLALANPGNQDAASPVMALRSPEAGRLAPLPGTGEEVRRIAAVWGPGSRVATGREATEALVFEAAPGASVLHLAAHVVLGGVHPLESAVLLAPGGEAASGNGLLQAWEVMESLKLPGSLVTLSGCETGLGRERRGEGLIGLTRAFQYAGAPSVVASLWRVDDRGTAILMETFYRYLARGIPVAEALRRAQLELLRRRDGTGLMARLRAFLGLAPGPGLSPRDPAVWAAFQVHGDPWWRFRTARDG